MAQPIFDQRQGGFRIFVGNLGSRTNISDLQHECERYGPLVDCWVARNPPGFAFVLYKYGEDADSAVRNMDGRMICGQRVRVEHAKARSLNNRNAPAHGGHRDGNDRRRPHRRSRSRSSSRDRSKKKSSRHRHSSRDSSRESTPRRKHKSPSSDSDDSSSDDRDKKKSKRHRTKSKSPKSDHSSRSKSKEKDVSHPSKENSHDENGSEHSIDKN